MDLRRIAFAQIEELVEGAASDWMRVAAAEMASRFFGGAFFSRERRRHDGIRTEGGEGICHQGKMGFFGRWSGDDALRRRSSWCGVRVDLET